ncbi:MAG: hypothetical protein KIC37_07745 [Coriobacteriaceae bacterium]|nr:hypothetical protein [Coriobacteriaceae bacterium]
MSETLEVDATILEDDIPARITKMSSFLAESAQIVERHKADGELEPMQPKTDEDDKQNRRIRTGIRKDIQRIKDTGDELMQPVLAFVDKYKNERARILQPLTDADKAYKVSADEWAAGWRARREQHLGDIYADFAPDLIPLVPIAKIIEVYAEKDPKKKWFNKSTSERDLEEAFYAAVDEIAKREALIDGMPYTDEEKAAAKRYYFASLDLQTAQERLDADKRMREQLAELERKRTERTAVPEPEPCYAETQTPEISTVAPELETQNAQPDNNATTPVFTSNIERESPALEPEPTFRVMFRAEVTERQFANIREYLRGTGINAQFKRL